jgi:hypothetical protein
MSCIALIYCIILYNNPKLLLFLPFLFYHFVPFLSRPYKVMFKHSHEDILLTPGVSPPKHVGEKKQLFWLTLQFRAFCWFLTLRLTCTVPKSRLLVASKEIGLGVNADKANYVVMSRDQNAGRSHNIKICSGSFERVEQFIILDTTLRIQSYVREEIRSRLKSGNACYNSKQNLLSSSLLSKNKKMKVYITIISRFVLCGCETSSFTLRKEHNLKDFDRRVPM